MSAAAGAAPHGSTSQNEKSPSSWRDILLTPKSILIGAAILLSVGTAVTITAVKSGSGGEQPSSPATTVDEQFEGDSAQTIREKRLRAKGIVDNTTCDEYLKKSVSEQDDISQTVYEGGYYGLRDYDRDPQKNVESNIKLGCESSIKSYPIGDQVTPFKPEASSETQVNETTDTGYPAPPENMPSRQ